jgi:hypothetical protein
VPGDGRRRRLNKPSAQVRELFHWLQGLPNTERVSIGCERQTAPQRDAPQ